MAVLATVGVIDTGSITLKFWGVLGDLTCPMGADGCDKVLNSAWGSLFGQPLSLFGFLAYTTVLVLAVNVLLRPVAGWIDRHRSRRKPEDDVLDG